MGLRRLILGAFALGLVGALACGVDRGRNDSSNGDTGYSDVSSYDVGSDQGYPDAGVDEGYAKDVTFDEGGFEDLGNDSDSGSEELKAIACPDVQEEVGGPYRIDDANDEHDGWCLYTVRVHDFFRFDGCRSTGDIDRYFFDYGHTTMSRYDQCWEDSYAFGEGLIGEEYEGRLVVLPDRNDTSVRDVDSVLFRVVEN